MLQIPGFLTVVELQRGPQTAVLRAVRQLDGQRLVLKTHEQANAPPQLLSRLRREYELLCRVGSRHVVANPQWIVAGGRQVLAMDDHGGTSLEQILRWHPPSPLAAIDIALAIAHGLRDIHEAGLVHGALTPAHVFVNSESGELRIGGLGRARLRSESPQAAADQAPALEVLAYTAPELLGGAVDRGDVAPGDGQSDLYALGCILYELCTGSPPFPAMAPRALLHAQLARTPTPPVELNADLPPTLSQIVMKLLEKLPERRYRTAAGLERDLDDCRDQLRAGVPTGEFQPGRRDEAEQFRVKDRLYGRDQHIEALEQAWRRASAGRAELVVVEGDSGIGKSALLGALRARRLDQGVRTLYGRFEHSSAPLPYAALVSALRPLLSDVLEAQSPADPAWRARVRARIGEAVPALSSLLSEATPTSAAAATERTGSPQAAAYRLRYAVKRLLKVIATADDPLLLVLDDLQWANDDSLAALADVIGDPDLGHLLLVCAARTPVSVQDRPTQWVRRCRASGVNAKVLRLPRLKRRAIGELLAENGIRSDLPEPELASRITELCAGNPFHVQRLLVELHRNGGLYRDPSGNGWYCPARLLEGDIDPADAENLLRTQLQALPARTRELLSAAACIGNRLSTELLALATGETAAAVADALRPAIAAGLLRAGPGPAGSGAAGSEGRPAEGFEFVHDRIRSAALALPGRGGLDELRLRLGRALLPDSDRVGPGELRRLLAMSLLNEVEPLIESGSERLRLSRMNLDAALRAREATAFGDMLGFVAQAQRFFDSDAAGAQSHDLATLLYLRAEAEHLTGDRDASRATAERALRIAVSPLLRCDLFDLLIVLNTLAGRYAQAIAIGRQALEELGLAIPSGDFEAANREELTRVRPVVDSAISNRPLILEPAPDETVAALRILVNLLPPTDFTDPEFNSWLAARAVRLSEERGYAPESAKALVNLGNVLAVRGRYKQAQALAQLALEVADRLSARNMRPRILYTYACYIHHWTNPLAESRHLGEDAFRACQITGEVQYAGYVLAFHRVMNEMFIADELGEHAQRLAGFEAFARHSRNQIAGDVIGAAMLPTRSLQAVQTEQGAAADAGADGREFLRRAACAGNRKAICLFRILGAGRSLADGDFEGALRLAAGASRDLAFVSSTLLSAIHPFVLATAGMARCRGGWTDLAPADREQVESSVALFANLDALCPQNFHAMRRLLLAEQERLKGQPAAAIEHYDAAIRNGAAIGFPPVAALACDLAHRFWAERGNDFVARAYLREARALYARWGAERAVRRIDARLGGEQAGEPGVGASGAQTLAELGRSLDRDTMIEAALTVGGKIRLDDILESLMRLLIESTGAERATLVMETDQGPSIQARGAIRGDGLTVAMDPEALGDGAELPLSVIEAVRRSRRPILLGCAREDPAFGNDPYVRETRLQSMLCVPLVQQRNLVGIAYLENRLSKSAFSHEQLGLALFVASQAAMSITNAMLVQTLEQKVQERTAALEEARRRAEEDRQAAIEANHAKTMLLANVSHELLTPLNAIIGFSDTLNLIHSGELDAAQSAYLEPRQAEYARDIYESGQHLRKLIGEMLDLARMESGRIELNRANVSVDEVVRSSMMFVQGRARDANIRLLCNQRNSAASFFADGDRIRQVLTNLLSNAVKFTPDGGSVTIEVSDGADFVRFDVVDSGVGIAPDQQGRIFERFYRITDPNKPAVPGTGLGLALSKQLVELHNGRISVESTPGQGSRFSVVLPREES